MSKVQQQYDAVNHTVAESDQRVYRAELETVDELTEKQHKNTLSQKSKELRRLSIDKEYFNPL